MNKKLRKVLIVIALLTLAFISVNNKHAILYPGDSVRVHCDASTFEISEPTQHGTWPNNHVDIVVACVWGDD